MPASLIANTLLNGGSAVDMQMTGFTWSAKRLNRAEPVIGQVPANTSDGELDIPQGDEIGGIEAPSLVLNGAIDTEDFATDNDLHAITGIGFLTLGYLKELWRIRSSGVTTIRIYFGADGNKEFRAYNSGGVTGTSSGSVTALIEAIDITPVADSEGSHMIPYQIQCREVRA